MNISFPRSNPFDHVQQGESHEAGATRPLSSPRLPNSASFNGALPVRSEGILSPLSSRVRSPAPDLGIRSDAIKNTNLINKVSSTVVVPKTSGVFLGIDDILDPQGLRGKVLGKDYVLLSHRPHADAVQRIKDSGLKSLQRLESEADRPAFTAEKVDLAKGFQKNNKFSPDRSLIYFRPVVSNPQFPVKKDDVVIAVPPGVANVFNQEHRVEQYGTPFKYMASSMSVMQYESLRQSLPQGHFITQYNDVQSWESTKGRDVGMYFPEVCVKADFIDKSLFVQHSEIDGSLKGNY